MSKQLVSGNSCAIYPQLSRINFAVYRIEKRGAQQLIMAAAPRVIFYSVSESEYSARKRKRNRIEEAVSSCCLLNGMYNSGLA